MKTKLIPLPTTPREERLWKRTEIMVKNFYDPDIGIDLMLEMVKGIFNTFASEEADFNEAQILQKAYELECWLVLYRAQSTD